MNNPPRRKRRIWALPVVVALAAGIIMPSHANGTVTEDQSPKSGNLSVPASASEAPIYSQVLKEWTATGAKDADTSDISLRAADYANASEAVKPAALEGSADSVLLEEKQWVEYEFDVPQSGLYELKLNYYSVNDSSIPNQIAIMVNGQSPYTEAQNIKLDRQWKDAHYPPQADAKGNQIRPGQQAVKGWQNREIMESSYANSEPLRWNLSQGKQVIRIQSVYEPIAIDQITLQAPEKIPTYEEAKKEFKQTDNGGDPNWFTAIEAEQISVKSEPSVQMQASRDDLASPESDGKIVFNTMGGANWVRGGQSASWTFEVPEDGLYKIDLKYLQNFNKGSNAYRQIRIDGKVPYEELKAFSFPYRRNWSMASLGQEKEEPFQFYLTKGKHELSLTVTNAPVSPITESIQYVSSEIQDINRLVRLITGKDNADANRDWNIATQLPDAKQRLEKMRDTLNDVLAYMQEIYGTESSGSATIRDAVAKLQRLADRPNDLPTKLGNLTSVQETLSTYSLELTKQPLMLDQIFISKSTASIPDVTPSTWKVMTNTVKTFFMTFSSDYFDYGRQDGDAAITVWVNRGRDYVSLMQQMADEQFTPSTGIKVNVNIMPNPQLLILSNSAGREPDVALGLDQGMPADLAIRNSLMDLSKFEDYDSAAKQFLPGSLTPFHYDKGDYALPETIMFNVMFYRKDILEELKLKVPQTWDDIYVMLPTLQQRGYDFYFPATNYLPFFYQNNASLYTADGLKSGLDTPQSFEAFKKWTDFFNIYGLPREVPNFYMHFRNGNIPIGISDFNMYLQLLVAAPEISGQWGVAPIPGTPNKSGDIERWGGGTIQAGSIFKSTDNPEESWEFLKWWTSTETQTRFGNDMEMFNGVEFRWNTANKAAFQQIAWPKEHAAEINKQLDWFQEAPNVPGGYFTARELGFAWNRTVLDNMNFRESLEGAIFEINRELLRKQQEFGFVDKDGNVVRKLDVPPYKPQPGGESEK
ncbi:extracellular solute-binding protein [Paenibacillus pasadenensis]|uniref:extracellular solute-binding protein n=1 Tax=Paenibacillus pasadenensis TaxID=217090 RepID=UPI00203A80F3|nr:extracellular solute-binding protein [Paenibacillus pasadenensis]MCM3748780.1 extracellular solute-binding protein [Paenibacillus pasadenensis]